MRSAHGVFDDVLFAALLILPYIEWRWTWPRFLALLASGAPGIRPRFYRAMVLGEWTPVILLIAFWAGRHRPWPLLLLGNSTPLRLGSGLAAAVLLVALLRLQTEHIFRHPEAMNRARRQLEYAEPLLPHTLRERTLFRVVSVSAGVCEEVLFRGFLLWYLSVWTGMIAAMILSSILFGAGHFYMGARQVPKTTLAGLFFACMAVASGSLWPPILLHMALDWNSGDVAYGVLSSASPLARG